MDHRRFDDLTRVFGIALNRKRFLALLAGLVAPVAVGAAGEAVAKKQGKRRKRRHRPGLGAQGGNAACATACTTSLDCQACPVGRCADNLCGTLCEGIACGSNEECASLISDNCVCHNSNCVCFDGDCGPTCGAACVEDSDCTGCPFGRCFRGGCVSDCLVFCSEDSDCAFISPDCVCGNGRNCECPNGCGDNCPGRCNGPADCGFGCGCNDAICETCGGPCQQDPDCLPGCVCTINIINGDTAAEGAPSGECVFDTCPGRCDTNPQCTQQGAADCVCFLGTNTAPADFVAEGSNGSCGVCRGEGQSCHASTECCGQLVCEGLDHLDHSGNNGPVGACRQKVPPPPRRCRKHGQSCNNDRECCAQGQCYQGKCGEKDTHCHHDRECARGYRCQGGRLSPGHRRCRKNGKRKQHLAHKRRWRK